MLEWSVLTAKPRHYLSIVIPSGYFVSANTSSRKISRTSSVRWKSTLNAHKYLIPRKVSGTPQHPLKCKLSKWNQLLVTSSELFLTFFTSSLSPGEWRDISDDNICKTEQERIASTTLRGVISGILDQTKQDMIKQREIVNIAFYKRIQEIIDAKTKLEVHLQEVETKINKYYKLVIILFSINFLYAYCVLV